MRIMSAVTASLLLSTSALAEVPAAGPISESKDGSIGYPTVQAALEAVKASPGAEVTVQAGWTIVSLRDQKTLWSFAPEGNSAYPSAVKRDVTEVDGKIIMRMSVLCQAEKKPCDQLVRDFQALNNHVKDQLSHDEK